jgi:hypothetical protein
MERLLQLLDELDDLVCVLRHRLRLWPAARTASRG